MQSAEKLLSKSKWLCKSVNYYHHHHHHHHHFYYCHEVNETSHITRKNLPTKVISVNKHSMAQSAVLSLRSPIKASEELGILAGIHLRRK